MKFFFVLFSSFFFTLSFAQNPLINGRIRDAHTNEPLAFVNVIYNEGKHGVVSNIDGFYKIADGRHNTTLTFSLIGYESETINLDTISGNEVNIYLKPTTVDLQEVVVKPGINPALRIIDQVIEHRNNNNPEKMSSFTYSSYNRMHFTSKREVSGKEPTNENISSMPSADSVKTPKKPYLLLMEFISERKFKFPGKNQEKIIASRVSGFKDPSFTLIATQLQSFSFYNDFFELFDKFYLNPISPGSSSRYSYLLEDTFFTETMDTLFVISFKPQLGKNFDGMKGVLYINTRGYAIQNVIAEAKSSESFSVKIQQRYELIDKQRWFPTQLNTQLVFKNIYKENKDVTLLGYGTTYIRNIKLEPDVSSTKFSNIILSVTPNAFYQSDTIWEQFRPIPLSKRDSLTYHVLDSIGLAKNLDQRLEIWETLSTGFIPIGYVNVDLRRFLNFNRKEGFRVGIGMQTNNHLTKNFTLGGHYAYGISDKISKYGAFLQLFPAWESDTRLSINYFNDVTETGAYRFIDDQFLLSTELFRNYIVNRLDWIKGYETSLTFRALRNFKFRLSLQSAERGLNSYTFNNPEDLVSETSYHNTEAGVGFKLTFNEKFVLTPRGRKISIGTRYPVIWFNYRQGLKLLGGEFEYHKYEARVSKTFSTNRFGKTNITFVSGKADQSLPIGLLYNGHGNYSGFSIDSENSFGTMRMNEFYSSEFASAFFRQNFENLLFKKGNFKPEISLAFNAGYGKMNYPLAHNGIEFKTLEKGYYETGIIIDKIINQKLFGYGFAVYYRLGPYAFARTSENFSYKLAFRYNFQ